jgi:hypothetical protein
LITQDALRYSRPCLLFTGSAKPTRLYRRPAYWQADHAPLCALASGLKELSLSYSQPKSFAAILSEGRYEMSLPMPATQSTILSNPSPVKTREIDVALVSNTTSRNVAKDTAIQINGHIANEVHNWNLLVYLTHQMFKLNTDERFSKTLIVNYYPGLASKRCAHPVGLPGHVSIEPLDRSRLKSSTVDKLPSRRVQHCLEQSAKRGQISTLVNLELRYFALLSSLGGNKGAVCGIFRADCQRNYISNRIVRRFSLRSYVDVSVDTSTVIAGRDRITPTRNYVSLVTPSGTGSEQSPCRFYVVEHCLERFDVLIGSDIITNLSSSSSARQDEPIGSIRPIRSKT